MDFKKFKRFFAFGCSYTSYGWPTWANLLSLNFDEYHNWALAGLGNRAIAERVAEANARYQFNENDLVIVQWSTHLRNDWFNPTVMPERLSNWKTAGSIFNYHNKNLYDDKWIQTFFYEPAFLMHTLNHVSLTQGFLKSTGCTWYMTSIGDLRNLGTDLRQNTSYGEVIFETNKNVELAWDTIPEIKIYNKPIWEDHKDHWLMPIEKFCQTCTESTFDFVDTKNPGQIFFDFHPSPRQHLFWIESELKDKLSMSVEDFMPAVDLVKAVENLHQRTKFNKDSFSLALSKRTDFPESCAKIVWPGKPEGF